MFYQLIQSILPLIAVAVPKYILNELLSAQRLEKIILYISILAGCTFFATCASQYLFYGGFSYRIKVGNDFSKVINKKLAEVDFKNLESPAFWDLKERAEKFLYADWHGFSYLLDSALNIFGSAVTLVGVIAIVAALNAWVMFLFMALMLASAAVESWAKRMACRYPWSVCHLNAALCIILSCFPKRDTARKSGYTALADGCFSA